MFYATVFVLPAAFVFVLGLLDWLVAAAPWQEWLIDLGWDSHVLAWGALGGVFSNSNIRKFFAGEGEVEVAELFCVVALFLCAVAILALRKKKPHVGWQSILSLAVGGASLVVPVAIALRAHM